MEGSLGKNPRLCARRGFLLQMAELFTIKIRRLRYCPGLDGFSKICDKDNHSPMWGVNKGEWKTTFASRAYKPHVHDFSILMARRDEQDPPPDQISLVIERWSSDHNDFKRRSCWPMNDAHEASNWASGTTSKPTVDFGKIIRHRIVYWALPIADKVLVVPAIPYLDFAITWWSDVVLSPTNFTVPYCPKQRVWWHWMRGHIDAADQQSRRYPKQRPKVHKPIIDEIIVLISCNAGAILPILPLADEASPDVIACWY